MTLEAVQAPVLNPSAGERALVRTAIGLILTLAVAVHLATPLNPDTSWLLTACERLLDGQRLYVDIAEVNPPMSAWLLVPFVALARLIGVAPEPVVTLGVIGFAVLSLALAGRIALRGKLIDDGATWWIVGLIVFTLMPVTVFAQREHFAVIAATPILACLALRADKRAPGLWEAVAAGLLAGLAVSIKPHFAAAIAAPALFAAIRARSVKPVLCIETIAGAAVACVYVAAVVITQPAYFATMVPIAKAVYLPNRFAFSILATKRELLILLGLLALTWGNWRAVRERPLFAVLTVAALGFVVGYFVQGRAWTYHLLPATTLAVFAFGLSITARPLAPLPMRVAYAGLGLMLLIAPAREAVLAQRDMPLKIALEAMGDNLKIGIISTEHSLFTPLDREIGATYVGRTPGLWVTGNAIESCLSSEPKRRELCQSLMDQERTQLLQDFQLTSPDAILIIERKFDWLAWAREDPELARFLDGYSITERVKNGPGTIVDIMTPASREAP